MLQRASSTAITHDHVHASMPKCPHISMPICLVHTGLATGPLPGLPIQPPRDSGPLVHHITSAKQMQELCTSKGGICVLGLAPTNVSSAEEGSSTSRMESVLKGVAVNYQEQPIAFAVVDASDQPSLRALLGLSGPLDAALPAIVAFSTKRMRYVVLPPPMTEEGVGKALSYVLTGSTNSLPLQVGSRQAC